MAPPRTLVLLACAWAGACIASVRQARAEGPPAAVQAHQAYDRGTAAYKRGDFATAAREYAAADAMAPNPVALQAALDAAVLSDDPVLGSQLLERARAATGSDALGATVSKAQQAFAHRAGRVQLSCEALPCLGAVDGAAVDVRHPIWVRVGSHTVTLEAAGSVTERVVTVSADQTVVVSAAPAPRPPPASAPGPASTTPGPPPRARSGSRGVSTTWFFVGLGATAVAGGFALWSGIDTANIHASFAAASCSTSPAPTTCSNLQSDGLSAQNRTNVLLGVTAALGVATVATALLVRWHASDAVTVSLGPGHAAMAVRF